MSNNSMKNLFLNSLRSKQTLVNVVSLLLFLAVVSFVLFEGTKKTVALTVDGEQQEILTHANTVGELLKDHQIVVANQDFLNPSVNTSIENNLSIEWEQARQIKISVDGEIQTLTTTDDLVSEVLAKANVAVTEHDAITPAADAEVGPENNIVIDKAFEVTLLDGVEEKKVWSTSNTVADFLKQYNIQLNEFDRVEQKMDELVVPNSEIQIVRVEKVTDVVEEATNFAVETKKEDSLLKGKEKVVQNGVNGTVSRTYEVVKENGQELSRNMVSEKMIKEPTKKVVAVGTKVVTASVSRGTNVSAAPSGGKEFYVTATAYTAFCNGCSGITATGINLKSNPDLKVIAVDPDVIPLGSKVWVEGYGYAVAGDTGGAINGNKIDLFMPSKSQAYDFGRKKVRIKVLN
ncbi:G5 and 3D domain-containing protein [Psychrobacillus antarcticus]|uniref:G5 and 3D domain-containing protein n=1 Tax=Psychrobacillus antarcticus TaxID=2879115 RepID=UPI002407F7EE|nr:G5 and 3D domain-containing protein [Psychrobacillus antarcticus]